MAKIYVASSWRNLRQPSIVQALRSAGHEVYDFRNPGPGKTGFAWSEIDAAWLSWTGDNFRSALKHPFAQAGFALDHQAMEWADTFVMVLPCGRSAHLELGWACGARKRTIILLEQQQEPELMYLEAQHHCLSIEEVIAVLAVDTTVTAADVEIVCQQLYGGRDGKRPWTEDVGPKDRVAATADVRRALHAMMQRRAPC